MYLLCFAEMFYVLAIMIVALFAWPLRSCLRNAADPFGSTRAADCFCVPDRLGCLLLYSSLWLTAVVAYLADIDLDGLVDKIASGSAHARPTHAQLAASYGRPSVLHSNLRTTRHFRPWSTWPLR